MTEDDGFDWAIEELRELANTLSQQHDPKSLSLRPLRVFNLLNQLTEIISEADDQRFNTQQDSQDANDDDQLP